MGIAVSSPTTHRGGKAKACAHRFGDQSGAVHGGAKLFAWIGGLALFFGVAFFIKYASEQHLIPPQMRAALGFLTGIGLLVGGVIMKRKETAATAQTLCSTRVLVLYGVTFACKALYHFPFFGTGPTFLLMTVITVVAFLLSVRLNAMVVAVIAMLASFLYQRFLGIPEKTNETDPAL